MSIAGNAPKTAETQKRRCTSRPKKAIGGVCKAPSAPSNAAAAITSFENAEAN
jgi:hypothetical protein